MPIWFLVAVIIAMLAIAPYVRPVGAQGVASYGFITYADITGTGAAVQVDTTAGHSCRYIQLVTPSTNSATLGRWGDSQISGTRGGTIAAGAGQFLPPLPALGSSEQRYDVTKLYVQMANGDKISVVCGQ